MKLMFDGTLQHVYKGAMFLCTQNFYMEDGIELAFARGVIYIVRGTPATSYLNFIDNMGNSHDMAEDNLENFKWIGTLYPTVLDDWLGEVNEER